MSFWFLPYFSAVILLLCRWLYRKYGKLFFIAFPFIWTAIEYIRTLGVYGFPWMAIAHSQTYYPALIQYADSTGVYGVSFWICVVNVVLYMILERIIVYRKKQSLKRIFYDIQLYGYSTALALLFIAPAIYGSQIISSNKWQGKPIKISLLQGNVDMAEKSDAELRNPTLALYDSLTGVAAQSHPNLIVWPETAVLTYIRLYPEYESWIRRVLYENRISVLTGTFDLELFKKGKNSEYSYKFYNAEVFYNDYTSPGEWYSKIRLVPFGEWFPYENYITMFQKLNFGEGNFTPGRTYSVFNLGLKPVIGFQDTSSIIQTPVDSVRFASVICFESVFSEFIRKFCIKGAQFLVVISNDNWFGKSSAHYQHAQLSIFRAIENRIGVAVCSNSGVSVLIDPYGRITAHSSVFVREILTGDVQYRPRDKKVPFYTHYGETFSQIVLIISILFIVGAIIKPSQKKMRV